MRLMKPEAHIDREDERRGSVVDAEWRVPPLHDGGLGGLVEWTDRPEDPHLLDDSLLVDRGLHDDGPVNAGRHRLGWVDGFHSMDKLWAGNASTDTHRGHITAANKRCLAPFSSERPLQWATDAGEMAVDFAVGDA